MNDFIFVKIPRTASSSLNKILKQTRGHATAQHWKDKVGLENWDKSYKFTIVREPVDRFISAYYHYKKNKNGNVPDINVLVRSIPDEVVFRPQYTFVYSWEGTMMLDKIYKYERLTKSWKDICKALDIDYVKLPHVNKSDDREDTLTDFSRKLVELYYYRDYLYFNYEVPTL